MDTIENPVVTSLQTNLYPNRLCRHSQTKL